MYGTDDDGNEVGVTISQNCVIRILGVEPDQESIIEMTDLNNQSERTEFVGAGVKK